MGTSYSLDNKLDNKSLKITKFDSFETELKWATHWFAKCTRHNKVRINS